MCLFCNIIKKDLPSNNVEEDDNFLAFHDINPQAPIHVLIVSKKHIESFHKVNSEIMAKMTNFIQKVAIKTGIDKSGYRLITNIGKDGGQEIAHFHIHLLGGTKLKWDRKIDANPEGMF